MKSKIILVFEWLRFNAKFFLTAFLITWLLIYLFPNTMLILFGQWAVLMKIMGAKTMSEFVSQSEMFNHILSQNGVSLIVFFIIGLFLQSPIGLVLIGAFYSFIAFLAPLTIGRSFEFNDWLLIAVEFFTLILSTSLASAVASEIYEVKPNMKSVLKYWKFSWTRLWVKPVDNWKQVLQAWLGTFLFMIIIIVSLSVFVAWFETYGY